MAEWPVRELGDLCTRVTVGHVGSMASRYVSEGIPFLRSQNVKRGRLDLAGLKYIDDNFHRELAKSQLNAGDLVIVRTGEPGVAAVVPDGIGPLNCSDLVIARPAPGVDVRFMCYAINETAEEFVRAHTVGAVQQHFNVASAKKLALKVPSLPEQQAIAAALGALDDKIAANEHITAIADSLRSACYLGAHAEAPSEFRQEALSDAAEFINGRPFTKDATGTGRMVVRIAELNSGPGVSTVYNDIEVSEKHLARPGDVLFAWSGSLTVARWFRPEAIVNQHIFKVVPKGDRPMWLVAELLRMKLDEFRAIAADKATTMGHIQRRHLDEPVLTPSAAMTQKLDAQIGPLWNRALSAEQESLKLADLRDTLLPQLMSGKLRVRDAEKIVEDAV
ncbi:hypothetical protein GCM10010503_44120 [Streptomyces lucensis JCM 4490]|uniref:Type I restriction modification DNA specificity domain-containing protein n=1 Tax=Streptomyces lucensis JCM 4490 TaxID=1306176 RepID=A0A918JAD5_9ACTN|nr:restriction endonuclease subunit S [Streptomyces lucensis]GGW62075.1 hypothetical protein GCM10010503_44120 [Streptomyces lucensis JCM 4490]